MKNKIFSLITIIFVSFLFTSCDFLEKLFLKPPLNDVKDQNNVKFTIVDENNNTISYRKSTQPIFLSVNTSLENINLYNITWTKQGNCELYSSGLSAIVIPNDNSLNSEITINASYDSFSANYKIVVNSQGNSVIIDNTPISSISTPANAYSIDINQIISIPVTNNANTKNVFYFAETSNNSICNVYSGVDSILVKGLKNGTCNITIYTENRKYSTTVVINVSTTVSNTDYNSNIPTNVDFIKLNVGDSFLLQSFVPTTIYINDSTILNVTLSTSDKHALKALKSGETIIILKDSDNKIKEIPCFIYNPNGTISSDNSNISNFVIDENYLNLDLNQSKLILVKNVTDISNFNIVSNNNLCTIVKSKNAFHITAKVPGFDFITVSNDNYTVTININISDKIYNPTPSTTTININSNYSIKTNDILNINYSSNNKILFFSKNTSIFSITFTSNNLLVLKGIANGDSELLCYDSDSNLIKSVFISVSENAIGTSFNTPSNNSVLSISPNNSSLRETEEVVFYISNFNPQLNYKWSSSDPNIASVIIDNNTSARIKAISKGNCYIICASSDGSISIKTILTVVDRYASYSLSDYYGINCNSTFEGYSGNTKTFNVNPYPNELTGQIDYSYTVSDTAKAEIVGYSPGMVQIKFKEPGLTTLFIKDTLNKFSKSVSILCNPVNNSTSPSTLSISKPSTLFMRIGEKININSTIAPTPHNVISAESYTQWICNNDKIKIYGTGGSVVLEAVASGESRITVQNIHANNTITIYIYVSENATYISFNPSSMNALVNTAGNVFATIVNAPPNFSYLPSDVVWTVVDSNDNIVPLNQRYIELTNPSGLNLSYTPVLSSKNQPEQYLKCTVKQYSGKLKINVSPMFALSISCTDIMIKPDVTKEYFIDIEDIKPINSQIDIMFPNEYLTCNVEYNNGTPKRISIRPNKPIPFNKTITVMHRQDPSIKYNINIIADWEYKLSIYKDNQPVTYLDFSKSYETFSFVCEPPLKLNNQDIYYLSMTCQNTTNSNAVQLQSYSYDETTNVGSFTLKYNSLVGTQFNLLFKIEPSGTFGNARPYSKTFPVKMHVPGSNLTLKLTKIYGNFPELNQVYYFTFYDGQTVTSYTNSFSRCPAEREVWSMDKTWTSNKAADEVYTSSQVDAQRKNSTITYYAELGYYNSSTQQFVPINDATITCNSTKNINYNSSTVTYQGSSMYDRYRKYFLLDTSVIQTAEAYFSNSGLTITLNTCAPLSNINGIGGNKGNDGYLISKYNVLFSNIFTITHNGQVYKVHFNLSFYYDYSSLIFSGPNIKGWNGYYRLGDNNVSDNGYW